jgi:xanthine dehydrogenase accessory factor
MKGITAVIDAWLLAGEPIALATVTRTWGSSPRPVGATLAVTASGKMAGSVSGGCIEGAVVQAAQDVLQSGIPKLLSFTASSRSAWDVGLSCGGEVEVLVHPLSREMYLVEHEAIERDKNYSRLLYVGYCNDGAIQNSKELPDRTDDGAYVATDEGSAKPPAFELGATVLCGSHGLMATQLPDDLTYDVIVALDNVPQTTVCGWLEIPYEEGYCRFSYARQRMRPHLICVGGVHIAITLTSIAKELGYRTTIIDPRGIFPTKERFAHVDCLMHDWPQEAFDHIDIDAQAAICVMTHDAKIDIPALEVALNSDAFYIGSLGRPTTQTLRYKQLCKRGFGRDSIDRIYGPIGLDLGGRDPEEIALSVLAEITAVRYGKNASSRKMSEFAPQPPPPPPPPPRVAAVILAAGESRRMGECKLTLSLDGESLIRRTVRCALEAGLRPVLVVTGAHRKAIEAELDSMPVVLAHNTDWLTGQSSSIRTGIGALSNSEDDERDTGIDAAVLMVGDQPFVTSDLLQRLARQYAAIPVDERTKVMVAPVVREKPRNPVLFDASCFSQLAALQGDTGAQQVFGVMNVIPVPVDDPHLFSDIDTKEDYLALCETRVSTAD